MHANRFRLQSSRSFHGDKFSSRNLLGSESFLHSLMCYECVCSLMLNSGNLDNHSISNLILPLCRTCFLILPLETSLHNPPHLVITITSNTKMPVLSICVASVVLCPHDLYALMLLVLQNLFFRRLGVEAYKIWYIATSSSRNSSSNSSV